MDIEKLSEKLFKNIEGWQLRTLKRIGKRIAVIGKMSADDVKLINNIAVVNQDLNSILSDLSVISEKNVKELENIYSNALGEVYGDKKELFDYRGIDYVPLEKNYYLQAMIKSFAKNSASEMLNISKTKALGIVNKQGQFIGLQDVLYNAIGKSATTIINGVTDFYTGMRDTIEEIGDSGMRVKYGTLTRRLDTVIRQNLMFSVKQATQEYDSTLGKQLGCDGFEVDWHFYPRESHEFMQGQMYTYAPDAVTIDGKTYQSGTEALARMQDYNCKHVKTDVILGISEPRYSKEEIDRLNKESARKITIEVNGKEQTKTGYEWSQAMRRLETEIRYKKEKSEFAKACGDNNLVTKTNKEIEKILQTYKKISQATGIKEDFNRMRIN